MYCRNCGNNLDDNAAACTKCGFDPRKGGKYCPNCGSEVNEGQVICVKCGVSLANSAGSTASAPAQSAPKDRIVYILLALFLGGFGVHNFYAGYKDKGIIQLIVNILGGAATCGLATIGVCIWAVVEAVTVKQDAAGVPFK